MKIDVCIPLSDVKYVPKLMTVLRKQDVTNVIIVNNCTGPSFEIDGAVVVKGVQGLRGRSRNIGIEKFLELGSDHLIFIDQDCVPASESFVSEYKKVMRSNTLMYGMRTQVVGGPLPVNVTLCVSSNNLGKTLSDENYDMGDIRVSKNLIDVYNNLTGFQKKLYAVTETLCWSCNFCASRDVLEKVRFDNDRTVWGYEDVLFSVDAIFKHGVDVKFITSPDSYVHHIMHDTAKEDNITYHSRERMRAIEYVFKIVAEKAKATFDDHINKAVRHFEP